ncbi:MAG: bifunctional phosphoribosyl-AMP cyclohydrolase/phosphoribosyl-ATP diphosphatase HisIE [Gracilibacteraceae bacterium]|jgi:phosphoribosyl-ATP pyrophosphohydrolase/phosphoribosyl-AMP cyclohydrolase|nr:bifunctional phosphoribosyl-AMP cyclohydrolase/phosphoribosyl-ATP diphosphatase HisIE [Gracilibacteraceae bacterium]
MAEWMEEIKWNAEGLVPAVAQDEETGAVLMLAWMNREALARTLQEGRACYYSRSRAALWLKGETSGHFQEVRAVRLDCDKDSILLIVRQTGLACHEGYYSCFHYAPPPEEGAEWAATGAPGERPTPSVGAVLEQLAELVAARRREMPPGAYTTYLFEQGLDKILKKVGEESAEVIIAAKNRVPAEVRYETADLFYHILVLLEEQGVSLADVAAELLSRRK